ncbi:hypothetical protein MMC28_001937 [Mycoblastus sanguinarius]|nr:hypothetical protein [Mycoblastus sanguinarius]
MLSHALFALLSTLLPTALAHGHQVPISDDADWATRHMAEEHHIANLDPSAFFTLHDYDSSGTWTAEEIRRTYGLDDESTREIDQGKKEDVTKVVVELFDKDGDGTISRDEWMNGWMKEGKRLPDFGVGIITIKVIDDWHWRKSSVWDTMRLAFELGPGHHGDDEYEYEIHHFEKFHDENTREEDLTHPEDIAHFRKHDEMDAAAERQEQLDQMPIVEQNIPQKFRRY